MIGYFLPGVALHMFDELYLSDVFTLLKLYLYLNYKEISFFNSTSQKTVIIINCPRFHLDIEKNLFFITHKTPGNKKHEGEIKNCLVQSKKQSFNILKNVIRKRKKCK